jgi:hypothetical protein
MNGGQGEDAGAMMLFLFDGFCLTVLGCQLSIDVAEWFWFEGGTLVEETGIRETLGRLTIRVDVECRLLGGEAFVDCSLGLF